MKGQLDRGRARTLMSERNVDALLLIQPETIRYAFGALPGNVANIRRLGAAFILIPCDAGDEASAVIGDCYAEGFAEASGISDIREMPFWLARSDIRDLQGGAPVRERLASASGTHFIERPPLFDVQEAARTLSALLEERGYSSSRLAVELDFLPVADAGMLFDALPGIDWVDAGDIVRRLRTIKSPEERKRLAGASQAAEKGLEEASQRIREGETVRELQDIWRQVTIEHARASFSGSPVDAYCTILAGEDLRSGSYELRSGDVVRLDLCCSIDGYTSDSARTFVIDTPNDDVVDVFNALHTAYQSIEAALKPGKALSELHAVALQHMHDQGFPYYSRGNFGHGLGASRFVEEWPYVARSETERLQTGMVMAFEVTWQILGLGALMIENQFEIGPGPDAPVAEWTFPPGLNRV